MVIAVAGQGEGEGGGHDEKEQQVSHAEILAPLPWRRHRKWSEKGGLEMGPTTLAGDEGAGGGFDDWGGGAGGVGS